jgi:CBS domain-containing protein
MKAVRNRLHDLTADDLMTREVVRLSEDQSLREAVRLLLRHQVGGAPVVDAQGRCVGVLSATDVLRLAGQRTDVRHAAAPALPITCSFQAKHRGPDGREQILCTLPPGVCPIQLRQREPGGQELLVCRQPRCVLVDWQVVNVEDLPEDRVSRHMTANPVTVRADTPIRRLARMMIDAHIHRVVVVDGEDHPVGMVSGTDLLAAIAYAEDAP